MSLWWLEPGWGDARCAQCGVNIQSTSGDPDWGLCLACMQYSVEQKEVERRYYAEQEESYYASLRGEEEYQSWSHAEAEGRGK